MACNSPSPQQCPTLCLPPNCPGRAHGHGAHGRGRRGGSRAHDQEGGRGGGGGRHGRGRGGGQFVLLQPSPAGGSMAREVGFLPHTGPDLNPPGTERLSRLPRAPPPPSPPVTERPLRGPPSPAASATCAGDEARAPDTIRRKALTYLPPLSTESIRRTNSFPTSYWSPRAAVGETRYD